MKHLGILLAVVCCLAATSSPAAIYVFEENFDAGWFSGGNWTLEGTPNPGIEVADFAAGDPRLDNNAGRTAGGLYWERGVSGDGSNWAGGDNEHVWIDFHMPVPNGTYPFRVAVDAQLKWSTILQPWGQGICMYLGDADVMAYGTIPAHGVPTGPWGGYSHDGGAYVEDTPLMGTKWNEANWPDGEWQALEFTQNNVDAGNTVTVTSGELIFRTTIRVKNDDQLSPEFRSYALDNLRIELIPEPATGALFALGLGALARLRRRSR